MTTLTAAAHLMRYSSPQSFGRHVRQVVGRTPGEWKAQGAGSFRARFRAGLVDPFLFILRSAPIHLPLRADRRKAA